MKTMNEQQFKNLVLSGYIPTSNEDIANIQDTIGYLSYEYLAVLATDIHVKDNLQKLIEKVCDNSMWDTISKWAANIIEQEVKIINLRNQLETITNQIKEIEESYDHDLYCKYYGYQK